MKVKIDMCWKGKDMIYARANICGGLLVPAPGGKWTRKVASAMLDLLELNMYYPRRRNIRFVH